jgi:hypothetical protein
MTTSTNYITERRAAELAGVSHWVIANGSKGGGCALGSLGVSIAIC